MEHERGERVERVERAEASRPEKGSKWRRMLQQRLPILRWAGRYDRLTALADLVAGVTLGLTLVPQSIAYAALADLPVHYGLYSSFVGTMLYVLLGTVKEVSIGPTSLMALFTLQTCRGLPIEFVVLLTFLAGCVVLLMGLLRLGFLVDLISPSVTSGFTSATAVIIVVAQLKGLLGLSFVAETVMENAQEIAARIHKIRVPDLLLALACCTVLLILRKVKDVKVSPKRPLLKRGLWLLSISRNALVVCLAAVTAYCVHSPGREPLFKLSGTVEPGLPPLSLPPFSATVDNSTVPFLEMVQQLGSAVVMLPLFMVLANIAIAKAFCEGGRVDATQEMVTLGLCNMAGALVHAMPTCGAFTRSAVSHSSGVRTPAAGFYSGIISLLALVFMTQYFYFIPKACLSSVLVCAVIFMVDVATVRRLWGESRAELGVLVLTFAVSVAATVELGVLAGVLASAALLLGHVMRPALPLQPVKVAGVGGEAGEAAEAVRAQPTLALVYVNAEVIAERLAAAAARACPAPLLVECSRLALVDHTAAKALQRLVETCAAHGQRVLVYNAHGQPLKRLERVLGLDAAVLRAATLPDALAAADAEAGEAQPLLSLSQRDTKL